MKKVLAMIAVVVTATLGFTSPASAGNQFTVTEHGIQLPAGKTFGYHNVIHLSWKTADGQEQTARMETGVEGDDPNVKPGAYYADKDFFAFTSLVKDWSDCPQITWISVNGYDQWRGSYDPDKCPTPPGDDDSDASKDVNGDDDSDAAKNGDDDGAKDGSDDPSGTEDGSEDSAKDGDKSSEGTDDSGEDKDGSKDGDHDAKNIDDDNADTQKDGSKDGNDDADGGEIPPTGISGMVLMLMLGGGLILSGGLVIANSRSKKAKH